MKCIKIQSVGNSIVPAEPEEDIFLLNDELEPSNSELDRFTR